MCHRFIIMPINVFIINYYVIQSKVKTWLFIPMHELNSIIKKKNCKIQRNGFKNETNLNRKKIQE